METWNLPVNAYFWSFSSVMLWNVWKFRRMVSKYISTQVLISQHEFVTSNEHQPALGNTKNSNSTQTRLLPILKEPVAFNKPRCTRWFWCKKLFKKETDLKWAWKEKQRLKFTWSCLTWRNGIMKWAFTDEVLIGGIPRGDGLPMVVLTLRATGG